MLISRRQALCTIGAIASAEIFSGYHNFETKMLTRTIPSSGEHLPVIGLGTWQQFDVSMSDAQSIDSLKKVLDAMRQYGGKVIDSSPMYGKAEEVVGNLTQDGGSDFFYATKVWTTGREEGVRQMNDSYRKMRREKMDLMQVHNLVDCKTHLDTLTAWKREGRVRYIGITHYQSSAHEELEAILRKDKPDFVQFNYSLSERNAEKSLLKTAADNGVAVIINEPYDKGNLFKLVKGKSLPDWAKENDIESWGQLFLKYILAEPAVTCIIPGTSNPTHAIDNFKAGFGRLPDEAIREKVRSILE